MQLLVVSNLIKNCSWHNDSCSSVVRCLSAVLWFSLPFVRVVQFGQSVSCSSSAVYGSFRSFGSSCSSVAGSCGSVVQPVYAVCHFAVADQFSPAQTPKHDSEMLGFFTQPIYKYMST